MRAAVIFLFAGFALCNAAPAATAAPAQPLDQAEEISPVLYRQRRQLYGGGGADKHVQQGTIGLQNPNGSGGRLSYGHAKGYGHDLGVDAMVPVWQHKNGRQESTLNLGGGFSHHFGGPGGSHLTDKRVGLNFVHRF